MGTDLRRIWSGILAIVLTALQGCSSPPTSFPGDGLPDRTWGRVPSKTRSAAGAPPPSAATNAQAYRQDAARHLYQQQAKRIYPGRLPPMLYAVGVLNVDIDRSGQIQNLRWVRAPKHAPEMMAEVEQIVQAAAPFPALQNLSQVTYTDVWLWQKNGLFQLDTLSEGQD